MAPVRVTPSPDTVVHAMTDGSTLFVNLASSQIYEMNPPGSRYWSLLADGNSVEQAAAAMLEEFDVSPERLAEETEQLLQALQAGGLVEVTES